MAVKWRPVSCRGALCLHNRPTLAELSPKPKMWAAGPASPWTGPEDRRSDPMASTAPSVLRRTRLASHGGRRKSMEPSLGLGDCGMQLAGYRQELGITT